MVNVGKCISPMDPMGLDYFRLPRSWGEVCVLGGIHCKNPHGITYVFIYIYI